MIQFSKLKLSGFKSFVDPVELVIESGMTGVVGPNGCGKSNLIEALRWVMGETSARQMRGTEMDDVIFGGTASRPARNIAEVGVHLDNSGKNAPARWNAFDELVISRRIERGQGSNFRVNGGDTRARDVQLLFADAATGARSSGLVSQGRIGTIINARPAERRSLLEEAAGISGLYSRRHEAENRLKNAEGNVARLDDIILTLDEQLGGLRKQARQAIRYRQLSEQIRATEARMLRLAWVQALTEVEAARARVVEAGQAVEDATANAARASALQADIAARLPALRRMDADAGEGLSRLIAERERLDAEEGRLAETRRDLEARLAQASADLERERARGLDAEEALARLLEEHEMLAGETEIETERRAEAEMRVEAVAAQTATAEKALSEAMEAVAARDAERGALLRRQSESEARLSRLKDRLAQIDAQRRGAEAEIIDRADLTAAEMEVESAEEFLDESRTAAEDGERRKIAALAARDRARAEVQARQTARARLKAEADALKAVLAQSKSNTRAPALDRVSAEPGYEPALAAALGDDLGASLDAGEAVHWDTLPPLTDPPALPPGLSPLARFVTAPPALARRLSQVGVAENAQAALDLRGLLAVGQRLVTKDGDLARWDGLTARAGAPSPMALRLAQGNRLREIDMKLEDANLGVDEAEAATSDAERAAEAATEDERRARDAVRRAETELVKARDTHAKLAQNFAVARSRLDGLVEQAAAVRSDLEEAEAERMEAAEVLASMPESDEGRGVIDRLRADLAERRSVLVEARSGLDRVMREAGDRRRRLDQLAADAGSWRRRAEAAGAHIADLTLRRDNAAAEIDKLAHQPGRLARRRAEVLDQITEAEGKRRQAAEALIAAEQAQAQADTAVRAAEAALHAAREDRIRREAEVSAADQTCRTVAARISERLDLSPEQLGELTGEVEDEPEELRRRFDRLSRERDGMGAVNLRAEQEVLEMEERLGTMRAEREDLVQAIARLRQGINELNREGRERLLASFQAVDRHFRDLFVQLFGGGRAHLTLTESDDPLEAGLEIMASPPGKRLQVLSLLSGGEQALTALALLFAVFMTNPAPICVLDEVDAPLDDANVDRFCSLVDHIAKTTGTRFLVVTHHRMTMARMDRLYGVTMAERGVSQLVSVDLAQAEILRDKAGLEPTP